MRSFPGDRQASNSSRAEQTPDATWSRSTRMESPRCVRRSHVAHEPMREPQERGPRGSPLTVSPVPSRKSGAGDQGQSVCLSVSIAFGTSARLRNLPRSALRFARSAVGLLQLGSPDRKYWPCKSNSVRLGSSPRATKARWRPSGCRPGFWPQGQLRESTPVGVAPPGLPGRLF